MQIVWQQPEVTVNDLARALARNKHPLAPPSIRTMLGILQDKGYVERRPVGRGHAYRAVISAEDGQQRILKDIINRAFNRSALDLVSALMESGMVPKKELSKVKQLIRKHEKGAKA